MAKSREAKELPWIEKYRPHKLSEVVHQADVVNALQKTLETANLPHLLFYGPPGTGKTSTILAVARELFGPELVKDRVLELNASSERGIDVIRDKVKTFAKIAVSRIGVAGYPCPPYKIIILDEADSMTHDAQSALRRTMEAHVKVTRFCIICNYVSRIIDPLTSRCAKFRFQPLSAEAMGTRLLHIARSEAVDLGPETISMLVKVSEGDMRKSITMLQTARRLVGPGERVEEVHVAEVAGVIPNNVIGHLLRACKQNSFKSIQDVASDAVAEGFAVDQLLVQLQGAVLEDSAFTDLQKAHILMRIAEADHKLIEGADEHLQLLDVLSVISTRILETD
jgi:replication factor C subunit 2/4